MKKQVTTSRTETITCCDICERECGNGFHNTCFICNRMCCFTCCRFIDFANEPAVERRLLELPVKICHECESIAPELNFAERISAAVQGADMKVRERVSEWRALAAKSLKARGDTA